MKCVNRFLGISAFALALAAIPIVRTDLFAKTPANSSADAPAFDPAAMVSVSGIIANVREVIPASAPLAGVHLTVKTKSETFDVYVGPSDFMKMLKAGFQTGDPIELIGSETRFQGANLVLASELIVGRASFVLRDPDGTPVWERWGVTVDPSHIGQMR